MTKLYRVENPLSKQGLWYREDGTFNPFIKTLTNAISRDLPMGFDPQFKLEGLDWISATDKLSDMKYWFSPQDLQELEGLGYGLFEFDVTRYRTLNGHAVFAKEHVLQANRIDLSLLKELQ
jgi:hypothetical protein